MKPKVDLRQLAVERDVPAELPVSRSAQRRRVVTRFVLPGVLLAGFIALLGYAMRGTLSPPRSVTVLPIISSQAALDQAVDTPLFRAAGWVEPRPTATLITALAEGTVEKLLVVEGQEVKENEIVARLVSADAQIALDTALADLKLRQAELASATASLTAAKKRLEEPLHLHVELADAAAAFAKAETEVGNLPFLIRTARSRLRFAQEEHLVLTKTVGTVAGLSVQKAKSDLEAAEAAVDEVQARQTRLPIEVAALKDKRDALARKLQLKTDEVRQVDEATAAVQSANARVIQAQSACDAARLRLARMDIRAPVAGRVLALVAKPGTRLMGQDPRTLYDSSTVLSLYDPANMQVRVDVPLDHVTKVLQGQKVTIETAALPGQRLDGKVLAATSQADVQKNTLSVKVAIANPPANLKPDMLCQVTFLAPPRVAGPEKNEPDSFRLFVPKQLVESSGDGGRVWIADLALGRAMPRTIQTGASVGDLVQVVSGLGVTDWLIVGGRDGLRIGDRIVVSREDETLGLSRTGGSK